jgi:hypothetical protein
MVKDQEENQTEFRVVIRGLKIPDEIVKKMEENIRAAAFNELAKMDLKGDYVVKNNVQEALKLQISRPPIIGLVLDFKG